MRRKSILVIGLLALVIGISSCKPISSSSSEQPSSEASGSSSQQPSSDASDSSSETPLEPEIIIEEVSITNKETLQQDMYVDETQTLTFAVSAKKDGKAHALTVAEAFADNLIALTVSDSSVLSVTQAGVVSALTVGEATITIAAVADPTKKDEVGFSVFTRDVRVAAVTVIDAEDIFLPNIALDEVIDLDLEISAVRGRNESVVMDVADVLAQELITITSSDETVVSVAALKLSAKKVGETTLTIENTLGAELFKQKIKVVERNVGKIALILRGEKADLDGVQDEEMALPYFEAYDLDGNNVSDAVILTDSLGEVVAAADVTFKSAIIGEHVLSYKLTVGDQEVVKSVKRKVYMRVLGNGGAKDNILVHDEKTDDPYVDTANTGIGIRDFYVAPSTQYYMEWEWSSAPGTVNGQILAGAHFSEGMGPSVDDPYIYMGLKLNPGGFELAHSKLVTGWNIHAPRMWSNIRFIKPIGLDGINPRESAWKMAVARDGEAFYYFIEDKLVNIDYQPDLAAKNTKPGFLVNAEAGIAPDAKLAKFDKISGAGVTEKIAALVGESTFTYYNPGYGETMGKDLATFQDGGFTYKDELVSTAHGMNDTMVVSNIFLGGDFTISFDFKNTLLGDGDHWGKVMFDLRTWHDKKTVFLVDLLSHWNENYTAGVIRSSEVGGPSSRDIFGELSAGVSSLNAKGKYNLSITREKTDWNEEKYTFELYNYDDPLQVATVEQVITYSDTLTYLFDSTKYMVFHSEKWVGQISNFKVSYN